MTEPQQLVVVGCCLALLLATLRRRRRQQSLSAAAIEQMSLVEMERLGRSRLPAHVAAYYGYTCGDGVTARSAADAFDSILLSFRLCCDFGASTFYGSRCVHVPTLVRN